MTVLGGFSSTRRARDLNMEMLLDCEIKGAFLTQQPPLKRQGLLASLGEHDHPIMFKSDTQSSREKDSFL